MSSAEQPPYPTGRQASAVALPGRHARALPAAPPAPVAEAPAGEADSRETGRATLGGPAAGRETWAADPGAAGGWRQQDGEPAGPPQGRQGGGWPGEQAPSQAAAPHG